MTIRAKLENFQYDHLQSDAESLRRSVANRLLYSAGKDPIVAHDADWYNALSWVVRDRLVERWMETTRAQYAQNVKRVYYLSMEFLIGRALTNSLMAVDLYDNFADALKDMGIDIDEVRIQEPDAALGNGGLGRLAACFLDSMATLALPGYGYGIRYDYGMFKQHLHDGYQVEQPDDWLVHGNPWEFPRPDVTYPIYFGGWVNHDSNGVHWVDKEEVLAMAHDMIIPGYGTKAVNTLRLWHARSAQALDFEVFNQGDYMTAVKKKNLSENVTRVLYPDDSSQQGKELRLKQEYFFVSASLQDIIHRFLHDHIDFTELPEKIAIHLNDTHPAVAVPELMRLLIDIHQLGWDDAWKYCTKIFSYTNHTLMPEALETWPVSMLRSVLPRHLEIIFEINKRFLDEVRTTHGENPDFLRRISLVIEGGERRISMAHLCIVASHKVNGVSKLHSDLLVETIFADFAKIYPGKFCNKTNGVTPRRWLANCNRGLAQLIDQHIGPDWRTHLNKLSDLKKLTSDASFIQSFKAVKAENKTRLAIYIKEKTGILINPDSFYDVHIKRMHEYKRQLLNVLHIVTRYNAILENPEADWLPRTFIFAGKSASAYRMAKLIIKLINDVANKINHDARIRHLIKVVFVPNYGVSGAEMIIPAANLSEQISTAGTEASGTGNMKLALNGALTIGTLDGANIEIKESVGPENIFIFGHTAKEVTSLKSNGYDPTRYYEEYPLLKQVLDQISSGYFSPENKDRFKPVIDSLLRFGDQYLLLADYGSYIKTHSQVDNIYQQEDEWTKKSILNVASMGPFSSDRTIQEYANEIWNVGPLKLS